MTYEVFFIVNVCARMITRRTYCNRFRLQSGVRPLTTEKGAALTAAVRRGCLLVPGATLLGQDQDQDQDQGLATRGERNGWTMVVIVFPSW